MIYGPQTPDGKRFPWLDFLERTELPRSFFKKLFDDESFLEIVADTYEAKGALLSDHEIFSCVERRYFSMFQKHFISEDIFWAGAFLPEDENTEAEQPHIEGFAYEEDESPESKKQLKLFRRAVEVFSKALYGDPHAWFSDFEEYFQKQRKEQ